ncbi:FAD binding domain-containing protein [Fonsecaea pedrosoi]|nr:FAD binding domain-containing protein [Fonsecaea pedrosoi]
MIYSFRLTLCYILFLAGTLQATPQQYCKPIVGSPGWPSISDWHALNESISGRLIAPVPPGLVCQTNSSSYSAQACGQLLAQWTNSSFHAEDPFTTNYNDDSCLPDPRAPCSTAPLPAYVVNATNTADVQAACQFAYKTGVRLIVKGTGHDFLGRSSGRSSLSVWTHNIRGINVTMGDLRAKRYGGIASVKIAAGMRFGEIYQAVSSYNLTLVGGADPNVGIGGWVTGGGHSPISAVYGLGADQVLEMEVVTANGTHLTINEDSYPDLFWAMRGGGGSTFAVLLSVTVRAYPVLPTAVYSFSYNTTANSDTFWSLVAYFHNQLPELSDAGVMGYYFIVPNNSAAQPDPIRMGSVVGFWFVPNKTVEETQQILTPLEERLRNNIYNWTDTVFVESIAVPVEDFTKFWLTYGAAQSVGSEVRLGSRLLDKAALKTDPAKLKKLFEQTTSNPQYSILGHVVAGKGVKTVKNGIPGGNNSVLPAWRDAYTHIVLPRSWAFLNETAKVATTTHLREVETEALRELAPNTGAYVNEADPTEPNWQKTFWGSNYPRLLQLKRHWDPKGIFWCVPCVGHKDGWEVVSEVGVEGAVGESPGRVCRTS